MGLPGEFGRVGTRSPTYFTLLRVAFARALLSVPAPHVLCCSIDPRDWTSLSLNASGVSDRTKRGARAVTAWGWRRSWSCMAGMLRVGRPGQRSVCFSSIVDVTFSLAAVCSRAAGSAWRTFVTPFGFESANLADDVAGFDRRGSEHLVAGHAGPAAGATG